MKMNKTNRNFQKNRQVQEWFQRAHKFYNLCHSVVGLAKKIASCANKELCYDLYSYVWDIAGVITLLCAFIKWLCKNKQLLVLLLETKKLSNMLKIHFQHLDSSRLISIRIHKETIRVSI